MLADGNRAQRARFPVPGADSASRSLRRSGPSSALQPQGCRFASDPRTVVVSRTVENQLFPGSFYTEPPREAHFAETGDEPLVVQITGFGPTSTEYVDPAQDPRRRKSK
jgi:hypothetical protein